jgi:hypothetical protein
VLKKARQTSLSAGTPPIQSIPSGLAEEIKKNRPCSSSQGIKEHSNAPMQAAGQMGYSKFDSFNMHRKALLFLLPKKRMTIFQAKKAKIKL